MVPAAAFGASISDTATLNAVTDGESPERTFSQDDYTIGTDMATVRGDNGVTYIIDGDTTLTTTGGGMQSGFRGGLSVDSFIVNDNAKLTATATGNVGRGLYANDGVTQNGGIIIAKGGTGDTAHGISTDTGTGFVQNGGTLTTTAGTGNNAHGMKIDDILTQNDGTITATGGVDEAFGIWLRNGSLNQTGGTIIAQGGGSDTGSGILMDCTAFIGGNLTVKAGTHRDAYSMVVGNADSDAVALTFGSNSLLTVDLKGTDSGKIIVAEGGVQIDSGARLNVSGLNTVPTGGSRTYEFLSIYEGDGQINGVFLTPNSQTLGFTADKSQDGTSYSVTVTRVAAVSDVVQPEGNASSVVSVLENAGPLPAALADARDYLDNNSADANFDQIVSGGLTPQQNIQALQGMRTLSSSLTTSTMQSINAFSLSLAATAPKTSIANAAGYASIDPTSCRGSGSTLWATPFFSKGKQEGKTSGFADLDEKFYGVSLGYTKTMDQNDFGVALNYIRGDYDASDYRSNSDLFGATLVGRHRFIGSSWFSPELSVWGGYGYVDQDQKRRVANAARDWVRSDPDVNQWYAGANLANHYQITNIFHIKPSVGLNYTYQRQSAYHERGNTGLELDVGAADYNSLLGSVGLEFGFALGSRACMKVFGAYEYEMGDKQATVRSAFTTAPALNFVSKSQDLSRHQGRVGAEFKYQVTDRLALSAGYDLRLGDHYINHKVNAGIAFDF